MTDLERFQKITGKMADIYSRKNADYGDSFHELFEKIGMPYAVGHIAEKSSRLLSLIKNGNKVKEESIEDSLLDCANYCILTLMELSKAKSDKNKDGFPYIS